MQIADRRLNDVHSTKIYQALSCARHCDKDTMVSNADKDSDPTGCIITNCTSATCLKHEELWELGSGKLFEEIVFQLSTPE